MRRRRHLPRVAGWCCGLLLAIPLLGGLAIGALVARLAHGPIEWGLIARQIERATNRPDSAMRIGIEHAAVAWEGWRGRGAPLDIRLTGVTLRDTAGRALVTLPEAAITFSLASLLQGTLAPATIELRRPNLILLRDEEGGLSLDFGSAGAPSPDAAAGEPVEHILADLMEPAQDRAMHTSLRRIRILGGTVTVRDRLLGRDWFLNDTQIELQRLAEGGLEADGEAVMRMGEVDLPVHLRGRAQNQGEGRDPLRFSVRLDLPVLRPSEIATVIPPLAPLAILDAPVAIQARAEFDQSGRPLRGGLDIQASEGGSLKLDGETALPFARLSASLDGNRRQISLDQARLELPGPGRSTLEVSGRVALADGGWSGELRAGVARLDLAELPDLWPEGLAPATRAALLRAAPRGAVRDAMLRLEVAADADLTRWRLPGARIEAVLADALLVAPDGPPDGPRLAVEAVELVAEVRPDWLRVENLSLRLPTPPGPGAVASTVKAQGEAALRDGRWRGTMGLELDRARFADLPALWPQGLGAGAREWVTENITAGEAGGGRWQATAEAAEDYSGFRLTALTGRIEVQGATVHWLRPIPPVRNATGFATFGLDAIDVQVTSARQENAAGQPGPLEIRDSTLRFVFPADGPERTEMSFGMAGPLAEIVNVVRHPRLHLFDRTPFPATVAAGAFEGRLNIGFPLIATLSMEQVRLRAEAKATNARLTRLLFDRDLEAANLDFVTDTEQLRLSGTASMVGIPLRLGVEMDFRPGPASQVVSRESVTARGDAERLAMLGFDTGALLRGPVAMEVRTERRRNGQGVVNLQADLRDAVLAFAPLGWTKRAGSPGSAEAVFRMQGERLTGIDNIRIEALELALRARATARAGRIERVEIQETSFGASRLTGDARAPPASGQPWNVTLRGPVLDLRSLFGTEGQVSGGAARDRNAPPEAPAGDQAPLALDLRFDQVMLGPERDLFAMQARGRIDSAGVLREASLRGRTSRSTGGFELLMTPRGQARQLRGSAEDGGGMLRAFGIVETIQGGRLTLNAQYDQPGPGAPLTGTAELDNFTVRNAPTLGKILQAMTLFGVVEAMQRGLVFSRAVVPFTLTPEVLRINDARAFSASLGLTARGRILRERTILDIEGTIVPAYLFNTLLGNLPLVGRLFSPEQGGGVFAATFRAQGPPESAEVTVNPLAALTPGFLRGLFGLAEGSRPAR
ncbi:DUF3971 domain-containing protein [Roseococcus sp. SYP-B2431]|uniref:YhdP family protein n=1 Tax=Roseococcus sp. SYP-B2431 TaxID=2496640 RepID=UPI00104080FA|nr:DUF3971 domain-containing protein [Roseococcus sp. SYP-B2431]TCI00363.1 DUF3971 domain-containing protein [Roseococcus sp. SYP-B2431]